MRGWLGAVGRGRRLAGFVLGVIALLFNAAIADDAEPNLKLNLVKSFQVAASLEGPQAAQLSVEALEAPFIEMLRKRSKSIDKNNYDNVVSTEVQIASSGSRYAVNISFHYREPCVATRLRLDLTCPVWEHYEALEVFNNLSDATEYVMHATRDAARLFDSEFDRR